MDTDSLHEIARDPEAVRKLANRSLGEDGCEHGWAVDLLKVWAVSIHHTPSRLARLVALLQHGIGCREDIVVSLHAGILLALRHPEFSQQLDRACREHIGRENVAVLDREADAYAQLGAKVRAEVQRLVEAK